MSVRPSFWPHVSAPLGSHVTDFREIWFCGTFYENPSRSSTFGQNLTKMSATLHKDFSTSVLLTAVRNTLLCGWTAVQRERIVTCPRQHWTLVLLTLYVARRQYKGTVSVLLSFHGNNGYANASQPYIIRTLPVLSFSEYINISAWCAVRRITLYKESPFKIREECEELRSQKSVRWNWRAWQRQKSQSEQAMEKREQK
jgi:hypothetical protein